jgi:uncharacterized membrane protein
MTEPSTTDIQKTEKPIEAPKRPWLIWVALGALVAVLLTWGLLTPPGLLGHADAIGYAVCHRIAARSFSLNGRPMPLCARCTGTFLGVLIGIFGPTLLGRRRAVLFPAVPILAVLLLFSAVWAFDGINSYLLLVRGVPFLYETQNWMRLTTGTFHGITLGSLIVPVFNATVWASPDPRRTIGGWRDLAVMVLAGAILIGLVLTEQPVILYPLALFSVAGVLTALTTINTTMVTLLVGRDSAARTLWEALPVILLGLTVALVEVGVIDALRYLAFGTWEGFTFPVAQ